MKVKLLFILLIVAIIMGVVYILQIWDITTFSSEFITKLTATSFIVALSLLVIVGFISLKEEKVKSKDGEDLIR